MFAVQQLFCQIWRYFRPIKGIPIGINPAVLMANYCLCYFEFTAVEQLVYIIESSPPCYPAGACPSVDDMLMSSTSASSTSGPALAKFYGDAALHLLTCFRFTV
jgi:hypothetical protein